MEERKDGRKNEEKEEGRMERIREGMNKERSKCKKE